MWFSNCYIFNIQALREGWERTQGLFCFVFILVLPGISTWPTSVFAAGPDDFTVQRPSSGLRSRQQLREQFAEVLSDYLKLLVEDLSLIAQRLSLSDKPCSAREQKKTRDYMRRLHEAQQFLRDGTVATIRVTDDDSDHDVSALYALLLDALAVTQREVINVLGGLLERDGDCWFVACKAKSQLERYTGHARTMMVETAEYHSYLRTIVQNFEKSSC